MARQSNIGRSLIEDVAPDGVTEIPPEKIEISEAQRAYWQGHTGETVDLNHWSNWRRHPKKAKLEKSCVTRFTKRQWAQLEGLSEVRGKRMQDIIKGYILEALEQDAESEL